MEDTQIRRLGDELCNALRQHQTLAPLTDRQPDISIDDAYHISLHMLSRCEADGEKVIGERHTDPAGPDLATVRMRMTRNGEPAGEGLGSAVQGHPAEAVAWLANTLGAFDIPFRAGELILSGSPAPLVPARAGDHFEMDIEGLGCCSIAFS